MASQRVLAARDDVTDLLAHRLRADIEVLIRSGQAQLGEEDVGQARVVVLARVNENVAQIPPRQTA